MKSYMYIAIRRDLPVGQQVVQSVHAAIEACWPIHYDDLEHPSVIILGVKSETSLNNFENYVKEQNFHYEVFREPDRDNEKTSVAVYPVAEDQKILFKKFQLLK